MTKFLIISGSPRPGNTEFILKKILAIKINLFCSRDRIISIGTPFMMKLLNYQILFLLMKLV